MSDSFSDHAVPDGESIGSKSPGIVLIRFEPYVAIYSPGCDNISVENAEHDAQPFPVGIRVDILPVCPAAAAEKSGSVNGYLVISDLSIEHFQQAFSFLTGKTTPLFTAPIAGAIKSNFFLDVK